MKILKVILLANILVVNAGIFADISSKIWKIAPPLSRYFVEQLTSPKKVTFNDVVEAYQALQGSSFSVSNEEIEFLVGFIQAGVDNKFANYDANNLKQDVIALEYGLQDFLSLEEIEFIAKDLIKALFDQKVLKVGLADVEKALKEDGSNQAQRVLRSIKRMNSGVKIKLAQNINDLLKSLRKTNEVISLFENSQKEARMKTLEKYDDIVQDLHGLFDDTYDQYLVKEKAQQLQQITKLAEVLAQLNQVSQNSRSRAGIRRAGGRPGTQPNPELIDLEGSAR